MPAVWFATAWTRTAASGGIRANVKYTADAKNAAPHANRSGSYSSRHEYESHSWYATNKNTGRATAAPRAFSASS